MGKVALLDEGVLMSLNLLDFEVRSHYAAGREQGRLFGHFGGQLELARSRELLARWLPAPPARILDVGGGPGAYAFWLADLGYEVHLIDAMPLHIEQARTEAQKSGVTPPASLAVGDARSLDYEDSSADTVLLMGPLYHLTARSDRLLALQEAHRLLRPGGLMFGVGISRFASVLDGLALGLLWEPEFSSIVNQDVQNGQHRNPSDHPDYFTTAFFHHPDELEQEALDAGFKVEHLVAIEGPAWAISGLERHWQNEQDRETLLTLLRSLEAERSLLGASSHIMVVGRKGE